ncbi:hypothetical protein BGW42_004694 [Actinomortierella wolfii]|nr:hypothetical protein BGW42_004694 [Actinomortierella wolfii]
MGHRVMFLVGLSWFSIWSLIIGFATGPVFMCICRALQGIGAGLTIPSALATLTTTFPPGPSRNRALAVFGACGASGMVVGSLIGGAIGDTIGWRWIFRLTAIMGFLLVVMGGFVIPNVQHNSSREDDSRRSFDVGGLFCFMGSMVIFVYYLSEAPIAGWAVAKTLAPFIVGLVLMAAFVVVEFKVSDPVIPPRIWLSRRFTTSVLGAILVSAATNLMVYFSTLYLQGVLDYSTMETGLAFLVSGIGAIPLNFLTAKLLQMMRTKFLLIIGWLLLLVSAILFAQMSASNTYWAGPFPAFVVNVLGTAPVYLANQINAVMYAPNKDQGVISGIYNSAIQLGGPIGIAIATAISTHYAPVGANNDEYALLSAYRSAFYTMAVCCGLGLINVVLFAPNRDPTGDDTPNDEESDAQDPTNPKDEEKSADVDTLAADGDANAISINEDAKQSAGR